MVIFAVILLVMLGAAKMIDRRHDAREKATPAHQGFAVVDLLVVGMVASAAAAFIIFAVVSLRAL